ncbi:MAG: integrase [Conexibacter sp.]|nr:integrase [Conexibacter sp.]
MAKITIKELEALTANDAGRILREDGNLAGRISIHKDGVSVSE